MSVHPVLAHALKAAQDKFGENNVYVADEHKKSVFGVSCPMAFGWLVGGTDKVPLRRVIGADGVSGAGKSVLMMEHGRWYLREGGIVILVDTEEKVSDTLVCGLLHSEDVNVKMNYVYAKATSIEQAQEMVTLFKSHAAAQLEANKNPDDRVAWLLIWDSLTGKDTKGAQDKVSKDGSAAAKGYPDAANSIARYYKSLAFGDELLTLAHVQHVGKSMDEKALGDDELVPKGGSEPKYASSYHLRMSSVKAIGGANWEGKDVRIKCIKSSLGPDKRTLTARWLWEFLWIDQPVFEGFGDDRFIVTNPDAVPMTRQEAETYYRWTQQSLSGRDAILLWAFLGLDDKDKDKFQWPKVERIRFQKTWWDWDWALGNLLVHGMKYNEKTSAADKKDLEGVLHFVKGSNNNSVKCEELTGDDTVMTLTEFGKKVVENEEVRKRVASFLGITHYQGFREVPLGGTRTQKKGKKGG